MKIKQRPEDFIVEEISDRSLKQDGPYQIFLLEKRGVDTFGAKRIIGKEFKVPGNEIGVAGLKDKHALTKQFVSIPAKYQMPSTWYQKSVSLERKGCSDEPILLGQFQTNRFTITVRDITEAEQEPLFSSFERVVHDGVPNYFDSQRFGSLRGAGEFMAARLVKGDLEGALKLLLTSASRHDPAGLRRCRTAIAKSWGDWASCLKPCAREPRARREKRLLSFLADHPTDWKGAWALVERDLVKMYIAAYQSHLWNETVKVLLSRLTPAPSFRTVKIPGGELWFPKMLSPEQKDRMAELRVPLFHPAVEFQNDQVRFACLKVLKKEGVELKQLVVKDLPNGEFKPGDRLAWVAPVVVAAPQWGSDDVNSTPAKKRLRLGLKVELPPGSYATIVLKAMGVVKKRGG